jgi:D-alanyl-D-alanine carboxypeptidase
MISLHTINEEIPMTTQSNTLRPDYAHHMSRRSLILRAAAAGLAAPTLATLIASTAHDARAAGSLAENLDAVLTAGVAAGIPGVVLQIERAGEPVYVGAAGVGSIEQETPLKATDRFRIYSITKTFTATVVLQLVDEGVLSLDDTVTKWLDDPAVMKIPNVEQITLRQLLNHTSGIYDYIDEADSPFWEMYLGENPDWTKVWTIDELLAFADSANHAPYFEPGTDFYYSNTGYLLLGLIVEKATSHPYADELRNRILDPLALDGTSLAKGETIPDGAVDGYELLEGELVNVSAINLSFAWAAGAIVSTAADIARFARETFDGKLVSPSSFKEMFTYNQSTYPQWAAAEWGMGVWSIGEQIEGGGGGPGFVASMIRPVDSDLIVVTLANVDGNSEAISTIHTEAIRLALETV